MKIGVQSGGIIEFIVAQKTYAAIRQAGFEVIDWQLDHALTGDVIRTLSYQGKCIFEKSLEEVIAYYTPELERQRLLLLARIDPESCAELLHRLADDELLLRAKIAMTEDELPRCAALLDSCTDKTSTDWNLLRGDVYFAQCDYAKAREHYQKDEDRRLLRLETCCEKLGDYKMAYYYACKQR